MSQKIQLAFSCLSLPPFPDTQSTLLHLNVRFVPPAALGTIIPNEETHISPPLRREFQIYKRVSLPLQSKSLTMSQ